MIPRQLFSQDLNRTIRRSRDGFEYCLEDDVWPVSNGLNLHFGVHQQQLKHLSEYKEVLSNFLETHSAGYSENIHNTVRAYLKSTGSVVA